MGLLSGIFLFLFRDRFHGWDILGVNSFGLLFNHLGANLRHSHIPLSFGRLERWLLSPAQHQIHHSADPRHHDKNFGTFLAFWDHWAGSHHPGDEAASGLTFGLTGSGSEVYQPHATIGQVLMEPFRSQRHLKSQS
jgi:sterol desaturase/sphingolipid hydroxylase (fatty acid hydroxylase superfamily)